LYSDTVAIIDKIASKNFYKNLSKILKRD
jgi:hypothetical protein